MARRGRRTEAARVWQVGAVTDAFGPESGPRAATAGIFVVLRDSITS
jgi:hypothetical protein